MHTAMCVVGKNYRLQDIQLSKIIRGSAPNPGSVARGAPTPRSAPSQLADDTSQGVGAAHLFKDRSNRSKTVRTIEAGAGVSGAPAEARRPSMGRL
jgi:hypothetical protein